MSLPSRRIGNIYKKCRKEISLAALFVFIILSYPTQWLSISGVTFFHSPPGVRYSTFVSCQ